jgi:hypothetical protein
MDIGRRVTAAIVHVSPGASVSRPSNQSVSASIA